MKVDVEITREGDGTVRADCPAIPGCFGTGQTEEEARAALKDAIVRRIRSRVKEKLPICNCPHDCV